MVGRPDADDKPARRVLMVLFHSAPLGGAPMPRNVRNVRYLPRFGRTPVVVAPRNASGWMDPDALALVPTGTQAIRARCPEPRHLRRVVGSLLSMARIPRGFRGTRADSLSVALHAATEAARRAGDIA